MNNMQWKGWALAALILGSSAMAAQTSTVTVRDFQTWSSVNLRYKINKDLRLTLSEHVRLQQNSMVMEQHFTQIKAKYDLPYGLNVGAGWRYINWYDVDDSLYEIRSRWHVDLGGDYEVGRWDLGARLRYQSRADWGDPDAVTKDVLRVKSSIRYNFRDWKWDPTLSAELFRNQATGEWYKYRLTASVDHKLSKRSKLATYYRMEQELLGAYPMTAHVIGLKYYYTFKN